MTNFLLIHGSCHGAWCWRHVIPALKLRGHKVNAIDLPSHGADGTPICEVTLDLYAKAILDAIKLPTVIVGHSMAGFPISRAAALDNRMIKRLVYLCAYMPREGMTLADMRREAPYQPLMQAVVKSADGLSFTIDPLQTRDVFYHDCSAADIAYANTRLCPQAILPQETSIELGPKFETVPKSYVICSEDRTIPPEYQRQMAANLPKEDVYEMSTSHSPFFSDPTGLANLLHRIAD